MRSWQSPRAVVYEKTKDRYGSIEVTALTTFRHSSLAGRVLRVELQGASRRRRRRRRGSRRSGLTVPRRSTPRRVHRIRWGSAGAVVVLAALAYVVFALLRSVPAMSLLPRRAVMTFTAPRPKLAWPRQGEAAVGVQGIGLIASHGRARPTPIASVAKVMTAYVVLRDHPLRGSASGPSIRVTPGDAAVYRSDRAGGQSVVVVRANERLSERQALEGMLLPSGNNIATLLAGWDAGSQRAFVAKMNADARSLGLAHTHYTGASGVQSSTVSTARDQVRLAMRAMKMPAFAHIVGLRSATLPVAGRQYNRDALLGRDGIVGIKTGTTSQAGGCFLFAARRRLGGRTITVVGAVLHQLPPGRHPTLIDSAFESAAFAAATGLLASTGRTIGRHRVVRRGQTVAWARAPWTGRVPLRAARTVSLSGWRGLRIHTKIVSGPPVNAPLAAGQRVGTAVVSAGGQHFRVPLTAAAAAPGASISWRLTHP